MKATAASLILALVFSSMPIPAAGVHSLSLSSLRQAVADKNSQREMNIEEIRFLLTAAEAHSISHLIPLERVLASLPSLSDSTLEGLASRSRQVNDQIRAGMLIQKKREPGVLIACPEGHEQSGSECVPVARKDPSAEIGPGSNADPRQAKNALEKLRREQERAHYEEQQRLEQERRQEAVRQAEEQARESARQVESQQQQLDESLRRSQEQQEQTNAQIEQTSQEVGAALAESGLDTTTFIIILIVALALVYVVTEEAIE